MKWQIGKIKVTRIQELVFPEFSDVIPAVTKELVKEIKWLFPHFVTADGHLSLSIHSLIVETPTHKLVVDTCIGDGRDRMPMEGMHMLSTNYMRDMQAEGYQPEDMDFVLCTHLHVDHVGWNTRLVDGKWVPTFPNAKYIMDKKDLDFWGSIDADTDIDFMQVQRQVFEDSLMPVINAGLAQPVDAPSIICEGVRLISTPGHTPGHVSVVLESEGQTGLITGDFIHHPIQFHDPALVSPFDVDNEMAIETRRRIFGEYADTPTLIIGTHFAGPTAGTLVTENGTYRLKV
ncbi:MAG: MBL fold metallo-hydrolase [Gammaproteobacteria bacterium]|jgi:glyoxylase-like metal-dependent hydrolase (beta-lactamase superfamily II)